MRKKLPNSVVIGGRRIKVQFKEMKETWGFYSHDKRTIELSTKLKAPEKNKAAWETLVHECTHAALAMGGLDHILDESTEEAVVRCLEHMFLPALEALNPPKGYTNGCEAKTSKGTKK